MWLCGVCECVRGCGLCAGVWGVCVGVGCVRAVSVVCVMCTCVCGCMCFSNAHLCVYMCAHVYLLRTNCKPDWLINGTLVYKPVLQFLIKLACF